MYLENSIIKAAKLRYSYKIYKVMVSNAAGSSRIEGKYIILSYYISKYVIQEIRREIISEKMCAAGLGESTKNNIVPRINGAPE